MAGLGSGYEAPVSADCFWIGVAELTADVIDPDTTVESAPEKRKEPPQRSPQPRFHVILWDDDDHTYAYVIEML